MNVQCKKRCSNAGTPLRADCRKRDGTPFHAACGMRLSDDAGIPTAFAYYVSGFVLTEHMFR